METKKITVGHLVSATNTLTSLVNKQLPIKTAFKLRKALLDMKPFVETFEKVRQEAIQKYGEKTEDGNFSVKKDNFTVFLEEVNKTLTIETDVKFSPVSPDDFGDITLSIADIFTLSEVGIITES